MNFNNSCPFCKKEFKQDDKIMIHANVLYHEKCAQEQAESEEQHYTDIFKELVGEETYSNIIENVPLEISNEEDIAIWQKIINYKYIACILYQTRNDARREIEGSNSLQEIEDKVSKMCMENNISASLSFLLIDKKYVESDLVYKITYREN